MNSFLSELKRRNIFRVAVAYAVVGWLVIQVVDILAPRMALPEWVPGFVILMVVIGMPLALVLAWAYEITPEGLKKTSEVDLTASVTADTGRKLDRMIITTLALAVAFLLVDRFAGFVPTPAGNPEVVEAGASIAVLPFLNLSSDPEQEYFSDGISEELLNLLAQIPGLRVAARTSSFQFKGENRNVVEIGEQLAVRHVLEGSVRRSGPEVRITAQLIDASNGYHLWSATYDRELEDVFAVQDEISGAIVGALREELGIELSEGTTRNVSTGSEEAFEAYLRGRHLVVQRTRATIEGAVREFERAIDLDPDFALPRAEVVLALNFLSRQQYGDMTEAEIERRAAPHLERALALDPNLAEAHAAQGFTRWNALDFQGALRSYQRAVEINPNYAAVYNWMGNILKDELGREGEGAEYTEMARSLDPLAIAAQANHLRDLYERREWSRAAAQFDRLYSIAPALALFLKAEPQADTGSISLFMETNLEALMLDGRAARSLRAVAVGLMYLGLRSEAERVVGRQDAALQAWGDDPARVRAAAEAELQTDPDNMRLQAQLGIALAGEGRFSEAEPILEAVWDRADGIVSQVGTFNTEAAAALFHIRSQVNGDRESAQRLLDAMGVWAELARDARLVSGNYMVPIAVYEYLSGDRQRGLAELGRWVGRPGFPSRNRGFLQPLDDDAAYRELRRHHDAIVAEQRSEFLAWACGDNPWRSVWTPLPETCATAS